MATLTEARALGDKITDARKGTAAIVLTLKALRRATDELGKFSFADKAVGLHGAYAARVASQIARVQALQKRPFNRATANAIGLAVAQSRDLFAEMAAAAKNSQAESTFGALAADFMAALAKVLGEVLGAVVPWWAWVALAYYLTRD